MNQHQRNRDLSMQSLLHAVFLTAVSIAVIGLVLNVVPVLGTVKSQFPAVPQSLAIIIAYGAFWSVALDFRPGRLLCAALLLVCGFSGFTGVLEDTTLEAAWAAGTHFPEWLMLLVGIAFAWPVRAPLWVTVNRVIGCLVAGFGTLVALAHFNLLTYSQGFLYLRDVPVLAGVGLLAIGVAMVMDEWWSDNRLCRMPRSITVGAVCSLATLLATTVLVAQLPGFWRSPIDGFGLSSLKSLNDLTLAGGIAFGLVLSHRVLYSILLASDRDSQDHALLDSELRFSALFEQSPSALMVVGTSGEVLLANDACKQLLLTIDDKIVGKNIRAFVHERYIRHDEIIRFENAFARVIEGEREQLTLRPKAVEFGVRHLDVFLLPIKLRGKIDAVYVVIRDFSNSVVNKYRQRLFERSLDASVNGVLIFALKRPSFPIIYANPAFGRLMEITGDEQRRNGVNTLLGANTDAAWQARLLDAIDTGQGLQQVQQVTRADGATFWLELLLSPVMDEDEQLSHYVAIVNDITDQRQQSRQLEYQATHDSLTGLGNRALFNEVLEREFQMARRTNELLAVLFIDLDEFKPINDTLGHKVGDQLLISIAQRLKAELRPSDTLVRLGGDEFVLMLPRLTLRDDVVRVAERLLAALGKAHRIDDYELHISASIGIAMSHEAISSSEQLLQQADMAMYRAKQKGRNTYYLFTNDLNHKLVRRVQLRNDLQEAIEHESLELNYQPFVDAEGRVIGFEALSRWSHPHFGSVSPDEFITLAEETGQTGELSAWVTRQVSSDARQLIAAYPDIKSLAVNLSPLQFHRPNFIVHLCRILDEHQIPYSWIELELTESILMKDQDGASERLGELQALGFSIAIDDFGTGYSSFAYLRTLPMGKIKIDKSFVQNVVDSERDAAVCRGIINLARELGLDIIAEGVETEAQLRLLKSWGCRIFQGYHFSRPMPLRHWIEKEYPMVRVS